ncbi:hypothetical protein [Patulibacter sp.]|uniref:hypothetical protein n=1 Tax=Patulibacter sp. TaxID=1912859 RepID=UPI002727328E|nr:hypothetical protein [Patulibacter sp.]MDO9407445.1 hypothetical protein [Patulibacter sp.]
MSYAAPAIRWAGVRPDAVEGRPAIGVPAELSALGARALELLEARLTWRCGAASVRIAPGDPAAITFVGATPDGVTAAFRRAADAAVASVTADAAAGWTAADERERHRPFSWDEGGSNVETSPQAPAVVVRLPGAAERHVA